MEKCTPFFFASGHHSEKHEFFGPLQDAQNVCTVAKVGAIDIDIQLHVNDVCIRVVCQVYHDFDSIHNCSLLLHTGRFQRINKIIWEDIGHHKQL